MYLSLEFHLRVVAEVRGRHVNLPRRLGQRLALLSGQDGHDGGGADGSVHIGRRRERGGKRGSGQG
jgi:hypothetical protein